MSSNVSNLFSPIQSKGHEHVSFFYDAATKLKIIVAIHNTVLGPALGGCRVRMYDTDEAALDDALRLSEGMTYKAAAAGLDLGGGKAVIIADPTDPKLDRARLFKTFGKFVERLGGRYITAEDMGVTVQDVKTISQETKHVVGRQASEGGLGDPSPYTARGTIQGMIACAERAFGSKDLRGRKVIIQGVGSVGSKIATTLSEKGAIIYIADRNEKLASDWSSKLGATQVTYGNEFDIEADIFCPCAIGQTINPISVSRLKTKVIAGCANNQLSDTSVYGLLDAKEIIYAPDFVINGGGLISVTFEAFNYSKEEVTKRVDGIYDSIAKILDESKSRNRFPEVVAMDLAKDRIRQRQESQLS